MRKKTWIGVAVVSALLAFGSVALAADTSPYLIGVWEMWENSGWVSTDFVIVNPTTIPLNVYAAFFTNKGEFTEVCFKYLLKPNAKWYIRGWNLELDRYDYMGTAKFIALPATSTRMIIDPNAVIGGFQHLYAWDFYEGRFGMSQADLKGVTINLYTAGEVKIVVNPLCRPWEENGNGKPDFSK